MAANRPSSADRPGERPAPRPSAAAAAPAPIAVEGRNCWRRARAGRVAFLVDGDAYFRAFKAAAARAERSIVVVGWDINSHTRLRPGDDSAGDPDELGPFLDALVRRRRHLHAYLLNWDFALIYALEREPLPRIELGRRTHERVHFELDSEHPLAGSHHQKIVVIDDAVAFVGGLDLTIRRWDTPDHRPDEPRRVDPRGESYGPFHDVQMAVDGEAATALGELARRRWFRATGERIRSPRSGRDVWPPDLAADMENVEVAVARTRPAWGGEVEIREVETLHLDAIAAARSLIYFENQYFSSTTVTAALEARLGERSGPEVVMVLPHECEGWLEESAMGIRRARLLRRLHAADHEGRLRVYYPVVGGAREIPVHVHSKVTVVDDRLVRVGSANLNNRSMGLDSECDLAVEADGDAGLAERIAHVRNRLLAEHLGVAPDEVAAAVAARGSLIGAIEDLGGNERTLKPLKVELPQALDALVPDTELVDPERPVSPDRLTTDLVGDDLAQPETRTVVYRGLALLLLLLALAALWRWGPLGDVADAEALAAWGRLLRESWFAGAVVVGVYVLAGLLMFPAVVLIAVTVLLFGPVTGFAYALTGVLASAAVTFGVGNALGRNTLRRFAGTRLDRVSRRLAKRGILSVATIRLVPVAPFGIINLAAGASHIRFLDYLAGTAIGVIPGLLVLTFFGARLRRLLQEPRLIDLAVLLAVLAIGGATAFWMQRRTARRGRRRKVEPPTD